MHVQYEMIPCIGFREVQSVDADAGRIPLALVTLLLLGGWLKSKKLYENRQETYGKNKSGS